MTANQTYVDQTDAGPRLLDTCGNVLPALIRLLVDTGPIRAVATAAHVWPHGMETIAADVATAARSLVDIDLGHTLLEGWRTYDELRTAARATAAAPGTVDHVALATHQIAAAYRPYVELLVDRRPHGTVQFEVRLELTVDGLLATVSRGRLVAAEFARCGYDATITCERVELVHPQGQLDAAFRVRLGAGIALVDTSK